MTAHRATSASTPSHRIGFRDEAEIEQQPVDQAEIVAEQPLPEQARRAEADDYRREYHAAGEVAERRVVVGGEQRDAESRGPSGSG